MKTAALFALLLSAAGTADLAAAQDLFALRHSPARVERYSGADGALLNSSFIDVDGLLGLGGATQNLWDLVFAPNGEIWVSNYTASAIHRFSADGTQYLGNLPLVVGLCVGIAVQGGQLWVTTVGGAAPGGAYAFDLTTFAQVHFVPGSNNWDAHPYGNDVLLCRSNGTVDRVDPVTGTVTPFAAPTGFCEQAHTRSNGDLLIANYGLTGYDEVDGLGAVTAPHHTLGAGSIRGVAELGNGNVLLNGTGGLWIHDPVAGTSTQVSAGAGSFIGVEGGGFSSTVTCMSNPNSTGNTAQMSGAGSNVSAQNDVRLTASELPANAFGFFITGRMPGFVQNPGGSMGNLCLSGSIGRYVGAGQIQNSGATGTISLQLNLLNMPQPAGSVPVTPGETWIFQAWFRDAVGGTATSNFTNGMSVVFS